MDSTSSLGLLVKSGSTQIFNRPFLDSIRDDVESSISSTQTIADAATHTVELDTADIAVVRMIYIEADGIVRVNLLDASAATNEIVGLDLAGELGTGSTKFFAEILGFTVASGDTLTIQNNSGEARIVSYFIGGDSE